MDGTGSDFEQAESFQFCPWEVFDAAWYANTHMRRLEAGDPNTAHKHYLTIGLALGHSPNPFFDEKWYRSVYQDLRTAIEEHVFSNGFAHYCAIGYKTRDAHWLFSGNCSPLPWPPNGLLGLMA